MQRIQWRRIKLLGSVILNVALDTIIIIEAIESNVTLQ